jgi:hypothetical protein
VQVAFRSKLSAETWLIFAVALFAILILVVFGIRITSLLRHGDLFLTSGREAASIYGIWKIQKGYPLYEWPFTESFPLCPYNYCFYYSYARILAAFGVKGGSLPVGGSALTLLFTFFGAFAQWKVMRLVLRKTLSPQNDILLAILALTAWLGTGMVSWFALTVRPDMAGVALATAALWAYLVCLRKDQRSWILALTASVLFYLAWSFKQSMICTLAGTCLFVLLYRKDLRQAIRLVVPCGCLMALTLWIGGTNYRANVIVAPAINSLSVSRAAQTALLAFLPSIFFWAFWIYVFVATPSVFNRGTRGHDNEGEPGLVVLCFAACVSLGIGLIYAMRAGCGRNQLLEPFIASATLSSCMLAKSIKPLTDPSARRTVAVSAMMILSMAAFPAAQLLFFNRIGVLTLASHNEYVQKKSFAQCLQSAPKPLLTKEETFSLPWLSTGDTYPAYVVVWDIYDTARSEGRAKGGIDGLIMRQRFGSLLLDEQDSLFKEALQGGYRYSSIPSCSGWQSLKLLSRAGREKGDSISSMNRASTVSGGPVSAPFSLVPGYLLKNPFEAICMDYMACISSRKR